MNGFLLPTESSYKSYPSKEDRLAPANVPLLDFHHSLLYMQFEAIFHHVDFSSSSHSWNFISLSLPQRPEIGNAVNQFPWKYAFLAKSLKVKNVIFSLSTSAHELPNYMTAIGRESTLCLDSKAFHLSPRICPGLSLWSLYQLWASYDSVFSNEGGVSWIP